MPVRQFRFVPMRPTPDPFSYRADPGRIHTRALGSIGVIVVEGVAWVHLVDGLPL